MNPLVIALAVQRATDVVVHDEVMRPLRQKVNRWASGYPDFSLRERAATLIGCRRCTSVWAAGAVLAAARVPALRPVVAALAASQAAILFAAVAEKLEGPLS